MRVLLLLLSAFIGLQSHALTLVWDNNPGWPTGTTVEACINAQCVSGITANQHDFGAIPLNPGDTLNAQARAVAPSGDMSAWATLAQTVPGESYTQPVNQSGLWATRESVEGGDMALSATPGFHWPLNETSGTAVDNIGGYGTASDYDGVVTQNGAGGTYSWSGGAESWGSGGVTGGYVSTPDGATSGYGIILNNPLPLGGQSKITVSVWVERRGSAAGDGRIFFQGDGWDEDEHQFMFGEYSDDNPRSRINGSTYADSGNTFALDTKEHWVVVLDFTLSGNELKFYKNGNQTPVYQTNVTGTALNADGGYSPLGARIGASSISDGTSVGNIWDGVLCDMRIWLDAATPAEVEAIYDNTLGGGGAASLPPKQFNYSYLIGR